MPLVGVRIFVDLTNTVRNEGFVFAALPLNLIVDI